MMFFPTFDPNFILENKDFLDEIVKDTLRDAAYAVMVYVPIIIFGLFI